MKRLFPLLLILLLTACAAPNADQAEPEALPLPAEAALPPEPAEEQITYRVDIDRYEDSESAEDGSHLVTCGFDIPVLTPCRADGNAVTAETAETEEARAALESAAVFNERFEKWASPEEFQSLADSAARDLLWYQEEELPWYGGYHLDLQCSIYQTETLVSVSALYYSDTGGAHPNTWILCWNFDLEDGTFFEAEMLGEDTALTEAVAAEILRQASLPREDGTIPLKEYWEDHEAIMANWSSYSVTFDEAGMRVVFSTYELAPYVCGPQEFFIPYDLLDPHLTDHGKQLLGLETP